MLKEIRVSTNGSNALDVSYLVVGNICYFVGKSKAIQTFAVAERIIDLISFSERMQIDKSRFIDIKTWNYYQGVRLGEYKAYEVEMSGAAVSGWTSVALDPDIAEAFAKLIGSNILRKYPNLISTGGNMALFADEKGFFHVWGSTGRPAYSARYIAASDFNEAGRAHVGKILELRCGDGIIYATIGRNGKLRSDWCLKKPRGVNFFTHESIKPK